MARSASASSSSPDLRFATDAQVDAAYDTAKRVFHSGITKPLEWRIRQLKNLRRMIAVDGEAIEKAIQLDLRRSDFEAQVFETKPLLPHIDATIDHVRKLAHEEALPVPMALATAQARVDTVPKGAVLIIGAWNYPAQLTIGPLVDCIGAGNTAVLKPSEVSPNSAAVIGDLVSRYIEDDAVVVVQGAVKETTRLLEKRWDHIVYTGNSAVGRIVMSAAAKHLTPVTLELGGKCPAIVESSANLEVAARRVVQARFVNAGQTCLAADYVLVDEAIHDKFVDVLKSTVMAFYGPDFKSNKDYPRIINERHTERIAGILNDAKALGAKVACGGEVDVKDHYIAPTIVTHCPMEARLQKEEVFGPLLLVQAVESVDEAIERVNAGEKPLALYIFSGDSDVIEKVTSRTQSGALAVNDALTQKGVVNGPFGGVGESGIGCYHGEFGINEMSHKRTVFTNSTMLDLPVRYPPYTEFNRSLVSTLVTHSFPAIRLRDLVIPVGIGIALLGLYLSGYFTSERLLRIYDAFAS